MLRDKDAMATIAVKDLVVAAKFYGETLGLARVKTDNEEGVLNFKTGSSTLMVYKSDFAGTNKATAATWIVGNEVDDIVRNLKGKDVTFEHYDFPGITREGDVHFGGGYRMAWFKDPDGNILSIVNGQE
jgi:catechol 2,3-dioxygenase-like lactoylglutathione lyase family enzyme